MNDQEFMNKYSVSKAKYAKRVKKYGDPYMNSPLAKRGKKLVEKQILKNKKMKELEREKRKGEMAATKLLVEQGKIDIKKLEQYRTSGTPRKASGTYNINGQTWKVK